MILSGVTVRALVLAEVILICNQTVDDTHANVGQMSPEKHCVLKMMVEKQQIYTEEDAVTRPKGGNIKSGHTGKKKQLWSKFQHS